MRRFRLILQVMIAGAWAALASAAEPLLLVVMDPLAAPLSCPCVEGYAQRDYEVVAESLSRRLDREVQVVFGESLTRALLHSEGRSADLIIGKDSVVRADAKKSELQIAPLARLTGKDGATTQTGLLVVRSDDPASDATGLAGYRIFFGPAECDEKHAAAMQLLATAGVEIAKPSAEDISLACSDGACKVIELGPDVRSAAVISSYAKPLLEGCGTIKQGDLRVVAETEPVPFVTAFANEALDEATLAEIRQALLKMVSEPQTLQALESLIGFVPIDARYHKQVEAAGRLPSPSSDATEQSTSSDWPEWGGPNRNGVASWLPESLPTEPRFVWRAPLLRSGLGGVAISKGKVVIGDRDPANHFDVWRCYDAESGAPLWQYRYLAPGKLDYDNGPRATPLLVEGHAYLLGAFGHLSCVRLSDGQQVWRRNLRREYQALDPLVWGLCSSPLLIDGKLIVNPGAANAAWVALDPQTGAELWRTSGDRHGFASPIVGTLGGVRQLIAYDRTSLGGWSLDSGERLWKLQPPRPGDFNVPTPLVIDDQLFVVTENNAARLYGFDEAGRIHPKPRATYESLEPDTSSPIYVSGCVYCVWNDLYCLEVAQGQLTERWIGTDPALPEAGVVLAGKTESGAERLLVVGRGGELILIDPQASEMKIASRLNLFGVDPHNAPELLTQPALVGTKIYLRGEHELVCVQLAND